MWSRTIIINLTNTGNKMKLGVNKKGTSGELKKIKFLGTCMPYKSWIRSMYFNCRTKKNGTDANLNGTDWKLLRIYEESRERQQ